MINEQIFPSDMEPGAGWKRETPVVIFIFRRPETTARVFKAVSEAKPKKLFIIADGPRENVAGEKELCRKTREIVEKVNWDCEVTRNYSEVNLGCNERMISGTDWVFDQVEEAIILEDDDVSSPSFFRFCEEMLEKYRNVPSVSCVCGNTQAPMAERNRYSFSAYFLVHGRAMWKRSWREFSSIPNESLKEMFSGRDMVEAINSTALLKKTRRLVRQVLRLFLRDRYVTWDWQWSFFCIKNKTLSVIPARNLISNIGMGAGAQGAAHDLGLFPSREPALDFIEFPLRHPSAVVRDESYDRMHEQFCASSFEYSFVFALILWMKIIIPVSFHVGLKSYSTKVMRFFAKFYS